MSSRFRIHRTLATVAVLAAIALSAVPASAAFPGQGSRVLFARAKDVPTGRGIPLLDLFTMKPTGDDQARLIKTPKVAEYGGHWSPNGNLATFTGLTQQDGAQVYTARDDGTHRRQLTETGQNYSPNWSKNGKQIAWSRITGLKTKVGREGFRVPARGGSARVMVMDADGTNKHSIYDAYGLGPTWHPRRVLIGFSASGPDAFDVFTIKPNGQGLQQLTDYGTNTTTLFGDWSPDGDLFSFNFRDGMDYDLFVASTSDPNDALPIAADVAEGFASAFTANGERVIFVRDDGVDLELFSVRTDGSGEKQLTTNGVPDILTVLPLL